MQKLLNYFIKGLIVILPLSIAIYIIYWAITTVNEWLSLDHILGKHNPLHHIPGLGIIIVLLIILLSGVIITNFVTEPIHKWFSGIFNRLPIFRFIYSSIKDITEAFVGDERKFTEPVIVTINNSDIKRIGFITKKNLTSLGLQEQVAVYFPMSYSFAGTLYIVPKANVQPLDANSGDVMKFVVSGGIIEI